MNANETYTLKETGEKVRVLMVDSDESAAVWVVYVNNPDRDAMVSRQALTS